MSTRKSPIPKKAGRPRKEPPKGSLGWRIREARIRAGIEPPEMAERVGLKEKMISQGEHKSNFSNSVLMLLAMELRDDFGEKWLEPYAREGVIVKYYREMTPALRKVGLNLLKRLKRGEMLNTGKYVDEEEDEG